MRNTSQRSCASRLPRLRALSWAPAARQAGSEATSQRSSPSRAGDAHAPGARGGAAARRGGYMVRARRPRPRSHKALKRNACG
jgi:hypothetical protein